MLFNSPEFLIFLPAVFAIYWAAASRVRVQNAAVVAASYIFYGWWDWRFLSLIAFTSAWSWASGLVEERRIARSLPGSGALLALGCAVNLGILAAFKYYDFFAAEAARLLSSAGLSVSAPILGVALPVGVSFYTFQALSYSIDVYRRTVRPVRDPVAFFAYISFFPQLVAGPIERATNLLPQICAPRRFDYAQAVEGCRQALWGFFKKCVVADNCAVVANMMLDTSSGVSGAAAWIGSLAFAMQIYGDFSGYSDIAIGVSKLFGIRLMRNFDCPYFARDIAEFWRRWHISLTTWFRDYLYIPMGGSRCSRAKRVRNTFAIFLVSGLWHGANWTFVLWGAYHAALFLPLLLAGRNRKHLGPAAPDRALPSATDFARMLATFLLVLAGWTVFRAPDVSHAFSWLASMAGSGTFLSLPHMPREAVPAAVSAVLMLCIEWFNRQCGWGCARLPSRVQTRWAVYLALLWLAVFYSPGSQSFVYFQF